MAKSPVSKKTILPEISTFNLSYLKEEVRGGHKGHKVRNKITAKFKKKVDLWGLLYNPIEKKKRH
jgi:hypothetical protein